MRTADPRQTHKSVALLFGTLGLAATVAVSLAVSSVPISQPELFIERMAAAALAGIALRALRRKAYFAGRASLHKSFSLDSMLQGAILLNPQLPYPDAESRILTRNTAATATELRYWFRVRSTAALSIPLLLAAVTLFLAGVESVAVVLAAASIGWAAYRAMDGSKLNGRFFTAMLLGLAAAVCEGLLFTSAAAIAFPESNASSSFLLYAVLLTGFELSPVPLALGTLELAWLGLSLIPGLALPGVAIALGYRLFRAIPVLLLTFFYLPRYKMKAADLYDPNLVAALEVHPPHLADDNATGPLLSIVIPAYNEAQRLPAYLPRVRAFCADLGAASEILVVDDGSRDGTAEYVDKEARADARVRLIRQEVNQGKGAAVRRGVQEARGLYILFADADGATPIGEANKLLAAARKGADVVIGSRKASDAEARRERSFIRGVLGSMFYRITNLLVVPGILDTQCGFKLFRRTAARQIFPLLRESGWAFDVEILFLAQKFGMTIAEIPVNWSSVEGSKVRASDGFRFVYALFRIRHRASGLTR